MIYIPGHLHNTSFSIHGDDVQTLFLKDDITSLMLTEVQPEVLNFIVKRLLRAGSL